MAEVLILIAFAMSGMDVSLGGVMASIPLLKVLWSAMFALEIDTAFALSWVRVRSYALQRQWIAFGSSLLLALAMSFIIFEPLAVQLFQQTLNVNFDQALSDLGINIVLLTYARSGVAVFLGAILAVTNVERAESGAKRSTVGSKSLWQLIAETSHRLIGSMHKQAKQPAQLLAPDKQEGSVSETPAQEADTEEVSASEAANVGNIIDLKARQQRKYEIPVINMDGLSTYEKVSQVLRVVSQISDRELNASKRLMRPKFEAEESPYLAQTDCRNDRAPLRERG